METQMGRKGYCWSAITAGSILIISAILTLAPGTAFAYGNDDRRGDDENRGNENVAGGAGVEVKEHYVPPGINVFDLNLAQTHAFSRLHNFEMVGHSYFKGPWLTSFAQANGLGAGISLVRVHHGVGYLAGYSSPALMFGALIADVSNPTHMRALSFIPCNPGTRCPYLDVNYDRHILVLGHSKNAANPVPPPPTGANPGWSFWDVSNPSNPSLLSHLPTLDTHGFVMDDRYVYGCGQSVSNAKGQEFQIIDYTIASAPVLVSEFHIQGQLPGETPGAQDKNNPNGTPQHLSCHAVAYHKDRVYIAYRDAGLVVLDVTDRSSPKQLARYDYVPPFNGGGFGASHSPALVIVDPNKYPKLLVLTDEIFDCPPGFGRIIDISDILNSEVVAGERPANLVELSNYRLPHVSDVFDFDTGQFVCRPGTQTIYVPWFDYRSPSLFYQAWYDQGLRAWDISNPHLPREVGYFLSPRYAAPGRVDRQTREAFQDPDTGLIYVPDGNGGGLTVLRWIGRIPGPPIPGAR